MDRSSTSAGGSGGTASGSRGRPTGDRAKEPGQSRVTERGRGSDQQPPGASRSSKGEKPVRITSRDERIVVRKKEWGSVARKGAAAVNAPPVDDREDPAAGSREAPVREAWSLKRVEQGGYKRPPRKPTSRDQWHLPDDALKELRERVGAKKAERLAKSLKDAARAYAGERWGDVRKALRPLLREAADAPCVQELNGMQLYRTGRWEEAASELLAAHKATNSYDLIPAVMDCHRAMGHSNQVRDLWDELRIASPVAEVMAEGRIIMAESLADRGELSKAIELLNKAPRPRQRVGVHHLRSWYAAGDLYDRAGDTGQARLLFEKVASHDPDLADVLDRLAALA